MKANKVEIVLNKKIDKLLIKDNACYGVADSKGEKHLADAVIIATGGMSYQTTGSTGDGIRWAQNTGHKITECGPALVPFNIEEV